MSKKVRVYVPPAKALELRREARFKDFLGFLLTERRRVDKQIARLRKKLNIELVANYERGQHREPK